MACSAQGELPSSERLMDLEMQELREEMQRLKKQRALLQLRSEVAREKQLLSEAQQRLGLSPSSPGGDGRQYVGLLTTTNVDSGLDTDSNGHSYGNRVSQPPAESGRGIKRRCSETSESREFLWNTLKGPLEARENTQVMSSHRGASIGTSNEASNGVNNESSNGNGEDEEIPPTFAVTQRYRLLNRKEYNMLMRFLQHYFSQFQLYFAPDSRKIGEALRHIHPSIVNTYNQLVAHKGSDYTWTQFCDFLESRIKNKTDSDSAIRNYYGSSQRKGQSVREFARHLEISEANLEELLPDSQRIQFLWDRVLPEVRDEALPHQYQSSSFQDHVAHLSAVESAMPSRQHCQRKMPRRNAPR